MKKFLFSIFTLLMCFSVFAQEEGVIFQNLTFDQAIAKGKEEGKPIFIDCFTTWCGPCKQMNNTVFNQKKVGDLYNVSFICLKIDMEKGEGITLAKRYEVSAYPTFLFINPDDETLIHRLVGGSPADKFIRQTEAVLKGQTLAQMGKRYEGGDRDEAFVKGYINALSIAQEKDKCAQVTTEFLNGKGKLLLKNPEYYNYFRSVITSPYSDIFKFVVKNRDRIIEKYGSDFFDKGGEYMAWLNYGPTLIKECEEGHHHLNDGEFADFLKYMKKMGANSTMIKKVEYMTRIKEAELNHNWNKYLSLQEACLAEAGLTITDYELLNWGAFLTQNCKDKDFRKKQADILQERLFVMDAKVAAERQNQAPLGPGEVRAVNMMQLNGAYERMISMLRAE